ncbi:ATP-binding protein [Adlercreutzia sp. R7]|uniref:histidine kinase n=1 Tax=Adlercreutzia wanghongyangiae TaxID=3111451 RepID=A0ABU6IH26_9ACTN|nr:ATP-binding protein [Adlercreutzia sp. R7]
MRQRFDSRAIFAAVAAVVVVLAVVVIATGLYYFNTITGLVVQADSIMPNDQAEGAAIVGVTARMVIIVVGATLLAVGAIAALLVYRSRRELQGERYVQSIYQAIGENIDTAIFIVDGADRVVEAVFENVQDILGVPATKFFVMDGLSSNEAYAKVAAIVHSGASDERREWEFQCFNAAFGRDMWLRVTSCPVMLGGDEKIIYSLTDVTGEHDIRQRLLDSVAAAEEANHAKSNFLASMSHDIRTPMNAILGFSALIDRDADNPQAVREYNRKIATSGQHLLGLINDVLDMSKIESGKTTLASAQFNLGETVASVDAMMRPQTNAKHQTFTVEMAGVTHEALMGDEGRLRQILMNVLSNAMKYTPDGGSILFRIDGSLKRRGSLQHLRIIVRDTGIGMSQEYLDTIFDSFSREESSLTNKIQGTGLGMAITKNLVDLMGGTITVESELGAGSTFIIDLDFPPAEEEAAARAVDAAASRAVDADAALGGKHFLVAEDNDLNAEIIAAILDIHGASCEVAENGRAAVEKFAASEPGAFDVIFMDVQMPVMNGHEAARAIRALDRPDAQTIPIIAMTANAFAEDEREALAAGMNAHVAKPIDLAVLARTVASLTSR